MKQFVIDPEQLVHSNDGIEILLPPSIGQGRMKMLAIRPGLQLFFSDYKLNEPTCIEYPYSPPGYGFGFCLSGINSTHLAVFANPFSICPGQSAFVNVPEENKAWETTGSERVTKVNIMLSPDQFQRAVDPRDLPEPLKNSGSSSFRVTDTTTPPMRQALLDILECPYQGLSRLFFLEAKAMELVAYKLEQLFYEDGLPPKWSHCVLRDTDIDRMRQVAQTITKRLDIPPNLFELAKSAGLCRSRLHRCFKQVYGVTPFEYARTKRLEKAEKLLRQGEANITQAAFQLGYSSPSHFTKAFKQYFGYLPMLCRKK